MCEAGLNPDRREEPGLQGFLQTITRFPSLTPTEESELLQGIRGGSREPLDRLIDANLRRVAGIAGEFLNQGLSHLDLIAEGTVGLISAARNFDARSLPSFNFFAEERIRQTILSAIGEST